MGRHDHVLEDQQRMGRWDWLLIEDVECGPAKLSVAKGGDQRIPERREDRRGRSQRRQPPIDLPGIGVRGLEQSVPRDRRVKCSQGPGQPGIRRGRDNAGASGQARQWLEHRPPHGNEGSPQRGTVYPCHLLSFDSEAHRAL